MKLNDISENINEWFNGSGPCADIVISSRVRLARNLAGYKFLSKCSISEKQEILAKLKEIILGLDLGDERSLSRRIRMTQLSPTQIAERLLHSPSPCIVLKSSV